MWRLWRNFVKLPNVHDCLPCWRIWKVRLFRRIWRFWRILVKSPNVCKSVPYMVASHVGGSGEYGDFGDFGEFLSNRQMYVNHFHTWWPAMLANLANLANSCQIAKCMSITSIHGGQPCWRIWRIRRFRRIPVKLSNVRQLVQYQVASHLGESGDFGEYGKCCELLSKRSTLQSNNKPLVFKATRSYQPVVFLQQGELSCRTKDMIDT